MSLNFNITVVFVMFLMCKILDMHIYMGSRDNQLGCNRLMFLKTNVRYIALLFNMFETILC